jgi:hypothetical protein
MAPLQLAYSPGHDDATPHVQGRRFVFLRSVKKPPIVDARLVRRQPAGPVSEMIGPNSSQRSPLNFIICICLLMR